MKIVFCKLCGKRFVVTNPRGRTLWLCGTCVGALAVMYLERVNLSESVDYPRIGLLKKQPASEILEGE